MKVDKINVLFIEDNPLDVRIIREMLVNASASRFRLTRCESIEETLIEFKKRNFDVILLDLNLPDSQGYDTFQKIYDNVPNIPIVVLTGINDNSIGEKAVKNGAQDYLVKGEINKHLLARVLSYSISRKQIEEELKDSQKQLRDLSSHLHSVREDERARIALEIHDNLGQLLTALKMDLYWLNKKIPGDNKHLHEKVSSMVELTNETINSVKSIAKELRPPLLELGISSAIENHVKEYQNHTGLECSVVIDPENISLNKELSLVIFRIFQELLTNVARHAKATTVKVGLVTSKGLLELKVLDNGVGITEEELNGSQSLGLVGIQERVRQWNGYINIKGIPKKGTSVTVNIPIINENIEAQSQTKYMDIYKL